MADSTLKPESSDAPVNKEQDSNENDHNDATGQKVKKRRLGVDPSLIISDGRSKRRKTPSPEPEVKNEQEGSDPKDRERAGVLGREIYKKIMDSTQNGENMAEPFVKLPSKRQFPDYYEMIKHPMCLETVKQKLDKQEYDSLKEVIVDLGQIFNNAKRYNLKDSHLFQWAKKLHKMTRTFYNKVTQPDVHHSDSEDEPAPGPSDARRGSSTMKLASASVEVEEEDVDMGGGPSNASMDGSTLDSKSVRRRGTYMKDGPTVYKLVKPVLKAIRDARSRDGMNREISLIFENLPDKRDLPDYYAAIKDPISLSEIEERMLARRYETWEEFFEQVELMCNNAMQYNEDESDVFRDAQQIMAILDTNRNEIKHRLAQPTIPTQKFRLKPAPSASTPSRPPHNPYLPSTTPGAQSPYQPGYPSASPYPTQTPTYPFPAPSASPAPPHRPYLAPLPPNVVTDDIVSRLSQYPQHEQQAWASSLQPVQMSQYRQILANQEGRRRLAAGQTGLPLADSASSGRAPGAMGAGSVQPFNMTQRSKPPLPMIKHLDFAFTAESLVGQGRERHTIRLHNLKGVITHALIIGAETGEIEITAYIANSPIPTAAEASTETPPISTITPEVSLRINGNPGSLAKFVYAEAEIGAEETSIEQPPVDKSRTKPVGMKWSVPIAHSRLETKLEVVSTKAGVTEQCAVYITRQF